MESTKQPTHDRLSNQLTQKKIAKGDTRTNERCLLMLAVCVSAAERTDGRTFNSRFRLSASTLPHSLTTYVHSYGTRSHGGGGCKQAKSAGVVASSPARPLLVILPHLHIYIHVHVHPCIPYTLYTHAYVTVTSARADPSFFLSFCTCSFTHSICMYVQYSTEHRSMLLR